VQLNRKVLYATAANEIGEFELDTGRDVNAVPVSDPDPAALVPQTVSQPLVTSHFKDQLHGLCAHPFRQECLTAGNYSPFASTSITSCISRYLSSFSLMPLLLSPSLLCLSFSLMPLLLSPPILMHLSVSPYL
jgi:hypothetical protein